MRMGLAGVRDVDGEGGSGGRLRRAGGEAGWGGGGCWQQGWGGARTREWVGVRAEGLAPGCRPGASAECQPRVSAGCQPGADGLRTSVGRHDPGHRPG